MHAWLYFAVMIHFMHGLFSVMIHLADCLDVVYQYYLLVVPYVKRVLGGSLWMQMCR